MAYIYCWKFDKRFFLVLSEYYLNYSFGEFHSLWNDSSEMDEEYTKLKELINNGEEVYGLYYQGNREDPVAISSIVGAYNKEEYKKYKEEARTPIKLTLTKIKASNIVWFEKDFKFVNEKIYDYIDSYEEYDNLWLFERENYEMFLN